jgi:serine/threonine protein kinase
MERGSLFRVLSVEARALSYRRRVAMAVDACAGVAYLHRCVPPIIHRDIKSLNFLVDRDYRVKLADLGEAREVSCRMRFSQNRGTTPMINDSNGSYSYFSHLFYTDQHSHQ